MGILVLESVEDKEIPRRVVAVRGTSTSKQGVKVKVVDRNTLRVHLDATEECTTTTTTMTIRTMKRKKSPIFCLVFRDVLCVHAVNGNHIKRYLNTENDARYSRLGIKSLSSSDLSRLNRVLSKDSIFDSLCLDESKEQEQQQQQDKEYFDFHPLYILQISARDMWSKTGLPALHSLWNGTNSTWCSSAKFHLCLSLPALRCQEILNNNSLSLL